VKPSFLRPKRNERRLFVDLHGARVGTRFAATRIVFFPERETSKFFVKG
jgi:hypothetical protein